MSNYCFAGKVLYVDLSERRIDIKKIDEIDCSFLGGRGLNQSLLLDYQKEFLSPFDGNNLIIFGSGRLVGTEAPCATRMNIDSKNVFTGGIGSSNVGGRFPSELKFAGFDHVVISGKSEKPVYLWIRDEKVEIRDAKPLWGKPVFETGHLLKASLKDEKIQFIAIGPAGENSVLTAAIIEGNSRAAGRCGLGAIMGDKKLKAIVVRGTGKRTIRTAHPEKFSILVKEFSKKLSSLPAVKRKKRFGTVAAIPSLNNTAAMPVHNFADEYVSIDELSHHLPEKFEQMSVGYINSCHPCVIKCHHQYKSFLRSETPFDKLEANTIWDFGPRLGLTDPEDLLTCHSLCTHYGLDIDNTASVICWAMDCFEKDLLKPLDTDGLILRWGDAKVVLQLIKKIALREGIGNLLAEGSHRASLRIGKGAEKLSINIKGQDLIEPIRNCKGWALGVVVSPRGGTHTRGAPQTEFYRIESDMGKKMWGVATAGVPQEYEGKPKVVIYYERLHALLDSLGLCYFASNWSSPAPGQLGPKEIAELCSAAIGEDFSEKSLMEKGERILTLEKIYNLIHTSLDRKDDYPPEIFMEESIKTGPFKGEKLSREEWDKMLSEYYSLHGWDLTTGFPKKQTLRALNLGGYIDILEKKRKIV
jgi:aldehyde:ferredoxin oxidoreductase